MLRLVALFCILAVIQDVSSEEIRRKPNEIYRLLRQLNLKTKGFKEERQNSGYSGSGYYGSYPTYEASYYGSYPTYESSYYGSYPTYESSYYDGSYEESYPEYEWVCTEGIMIRGWNMRGESGQVADIEECKSKCLMTEDCVSFEYGGGRRRPRRCNLSRTTIEEVNPSRVVNNQNWEYCEVKLTEKRTQTGNQEYLHLRNQLKFTMRTEGSGDFVCNNSAVISSLFVCDGDNDCGDCTDEPAGLCDKPCVPGLWNHDDFACTNGYGPFRASYVCDGWNDCGDCSDETCEEFAGQCPGTPMGSKISN